jgi:hypothetical protein
VGTQGTTAGPSLLKGDEGIKPSGRSIPQDGAIDLPEALDRLVGWQTAANPRGKVKKWPDERAKIPAASGRRSR